MDASAGGHWPVISSVGMPFQRDDVNAGSDAGTASTGLIDQPSGGRDGEGWEGWGGMGGMGRDGRDGEGWGGMGGMGGGRQASGTRA